MWETLPLSARIAAALVLGAALGLWATVAALRAWARWAGSRRRARGLRGQRQARGVLENEGFCVICEEPTAEGTLELDGEPVTFTVRPDYLVRRGGRTYAVEVKTGRAADPRDRTVRRQLLEYQRVLRVDGVFLLDMNTRRLLRVRFPGTDRPRVAAAWLVLGAALGAAAVLVATTAR